MGTLANRSGTSKTGLTLLILLVLLALYHLLILLGLFPYEITLGGQVEVSRSNLRALELAALTVTILFTAIVAARLDYIKVGRFRKIIRPGLWFIGAYFLLNAIGNLAFGSIYEKLFFTPLALIMAICAFHLAENY